MPRQMHMPMPRGGKAGQGDGEASFCWREVFQCFFCLQGEAVACHQRTNLLRHETALKKSARMQQLKMQRDFHCRNTMCAALWQCACSPHLLACTPTAQKVGVHLSCAAQEHQCALFLIQFGNWCWILVDHQSRSSPRSEFPAFSSNLCGGAPSAGSVASCASDEAIGKHTHGGSLANSAVCFCHCALQPPQKTAGSTKSAAHCNCSDCHPQPSCTH